MSMSNQWDRTVWILVVKSQIKTQVRPDAYKEKVYGHPDILRGVQAKTYCELIYLGIFVLWPKVHKYIN